MGVPLSPDPLVRSQREPIKSVNCLGVVPCDAIFPTRFDFLALEINKRKECYYNTLHTLIIFYILNRCQDY